MAGIAPTTTLFPRAALLLSYIYSLPWHWVITPAMLGFYVDRPKLNNFISTKIYNSIKNKHPRWNLHDLPPVLGGVINSLHLSVLFIIEVRIFVNTFFRSVTIFLVFLYHSNDMAIRGKFKSYVSHNEGAGPCPDSILNLFSNFART